MTDKLIIIDEIDVSGCEKQGETIAGITCGNGERIRLANEIVTKHKLCKDNPNCVYKQLKRKEQALDEIENIIKGYCKNMCMAGTKETCDDCQNTEILNIINETKKGAINDR